MPLFKGTFRNTSLTDNVFTEYEEGRHEVSEWVGNLVCTQQIF